MTVDLSPGVTDGVSHYVVPMVGKEAVELHVTCRSGSHAWCRQDGPCRYLQAVTWSEHPQVMTEVDYAGVTAPAHAGDIDFVIVGETDAGLRRFAWFYRSEVSSSQRWWQPQTTARPWQDPAHFLDGGALLYGAGDAWLPVTGAAAATAGYPPPPGRREMYRHATGCVQCRCDVLSQRADWQRTHLGLSRYWDRSAEGVLR